MVIVTQLCTTIIIPALRMAPSSFVKMFKPPSFGCLHQLRSAWPDIGIDPSTQLFTPIGVNPHQCRRRLEQFIAVKNSSDGAQRLICCHGLFPHHRRPSSCARLDFSTRHFSSLHNKLRPLHQLSDLIHSRSLNGDASLSYNASIYGFRTSKRLSSLDCLSARISFRSV